MDELKKIKEWLDAVAGFDIGSRCREDIHVDFRSLFFMLALDTTYENLGVIGSVVNRSHAAVIHSRDNLFEQLRKNKRFSKLFREYKRIGLDEGGSVDLTTEEQLDLLQKEHYEAQHKIAVLEKLVGEKAFLTKNEIKYRELTPKQQEIYNERADLVLKSFNWKKYNSTFEKVYVGLTPL
jgi:hypothetical protein